MADKRKLQRASSSKEWLDTTPTTMVPDDAWEIAQRRRVRLGKAPLPLPLGVPQPRPLEAPPVDIFSDVADSTDTLESLLTAFMELQQKRGK